MWDSSQTCCRQAARAMLHHWAFIRGDSVRIIQQPSLHMPQTGHVKWPTEWLMPCILVLKGADRKIRDGGSVAEKEA